MENTFSTGMRKGASCGRREVGVRMELGQEKPTGLEHDGS
jgi:hypothetical protein